MLASSRWLRSTLRRFARSLIYGDAFVRNCRLLSNSPGYAEQQVNLAMDCPPVSMAVFLLARFDSHRQTILFGRQRARNKWSERARRIVSLIEVQYDCTVMGQLYVQKPAAAIGFSTCGRIAKNKKEDLGIGLFHNRIQSQLTAKQTTHEISWADRIRDSPGSREELGKDTILLPSGVVLEPVKIAENPALRIFHADRVAASGPEYRRCPGAPLGTHRRNRAARRG